MGECVLIVLYHVGVVDHYFVGNKIYTYIYIYIYNIYMFKYVHGWGETPWSNTLEWYISLQMNKSGNEIWHYVLKFAEECWGGVCLLKYQVEVLKRFRP